MRRRLAPIPGIPTKQGLEDPNADLLEIFDAIENLPNKPKQMFDEFRKWARGTTRTRSAVGAARVEAAAARGRQRL